MTLAELRALCERATPGPWKSVRNSQRPFKHVIFDGRPDRDAMYTTSPLESHDADFIAAARTWLPALIEVAALSKELADPLMLARRFHEAYEHLAPSFGYKTRPESAKPWEDVPEQTRALMEAVCQELTTYIRAALARLDEVT